MGQYRCWTRCIDCGEHQLVSKKLFDRRTRPKCQACGGLLDPSAREKADRRDAHDLGQLGKIKKA